MSTVYHHDSCNLQGYFEYGFGEWRSMDRRIISIIVSSLMIWSKVA